MKIDSNDMLYTGYGEEVCEHASGDSSTMRFLFRLTGIRKVSLALSFDPRNVETRDTYGITAKDVSAEV